MKGKEAFGDGSRGCMGVKESWYVSVGAGGRDGAGQSTGERRRVQFAKPVEKA